MFAFTCQVNVPSLYHELHVHTPEQMRRVSLRAVCFCLGCYAISAPPRLDPATSG